MKGFILITLLIIGHSVCSATISISPPSGWTINKNYLGLDFVLYTPFKPNRSQPVLFISTHVGRYTANSASSYLKNESLKQKTNKIILEEDEIISNYGKIPFIKTRQKNASESVDELLALVPNQEKYHLIVFSAPTDYFKAYLPDVKNLVKTVKLN